MRSPTVGVGGLFTFYFCFALTRAAGHKSMYTRHRRKFPMKAVTCRDVGVDCDFVARGETVDDVLRQCGEHARSAHGFTDVPPELVDKVKAAIRDEDATTAKA